MRTKPQYPYVDFVGDVEQVKAGYWPRHVVPCNDLTCEKREIFHIAIYDR